MYTQNYLSERVMAEPVTPEAVDRMARSLQFGIQEAERNIALAEAAAEALAPIAHYAKADVRAARRIEQTMPDVRASVRRSLDDYQVTLATRRPDGIRSAYVCVLLPDSTYSVADLIAALRALPGERERLARLRAQYESLEEVIDAEEQIRTLAREIHQIRRTTALRLLGDTYPMYEETIREELPGLAGRA